MYYIFGERAEDYLGNLLERSKNISIDPNLRGWSDSEEIKPIGNVFLPIYVVAGKYCKTARDVYLQYVKGIKMEKTKPLIIGILLHETMSRIIPEAKKYIYQHGIKSDFDLLNHMVATGKKTIEEIIENNKRDVMNLLTISDINMIKENMLKLWNYQAVQIVASVDLVLSKFIKIEPDSLVSKAIPISVEQKIDGSRIGLSKNLSVDALNVPNTVVMDVKTGKPQEFHSLTVTGYALAYEAEYKVPVNMGCIIYPQFFSDKSVPYITKEPFLITNKLRKEFIEERNKKAKIILEQIDPGLPDECSKACGYYAICHPS